MDCRHTAKPPRFIRRNDASADIRRTTEHVRLVTTWTPQLTNYLFIFILFIFIYQPLHSYGQTTIARIEYADAFRLDRSDLLEASGVKVGQNIIPERLTRFARQLENGLYDRGYLFARVDSVSVRSAQKPKHVELYFYGSSGLPTYIGSVQLLSDSIESTQYLQASELGTGLPYYPKLVEKSIQYFLDIAARNGFLFANIEVTDLKIVQEQDRNIAHINLRIREQERVYLDRVLITGNLYTREEVLLRELPLQSGQRMDLSILEDIPLRLTRLGLFKSVKPVQVLRSAEDSVHLKITVEEGNATTFDGVVGYIPESANKANGYFTGMVDIAFNNLFGSGRKFNVHWKKPDALSEEFKTVYAEPWIFGFPVDAGVELERTVRDTSFIQWSYAFNTRIRILRDLSFIGQLRQSSYIPDSSASRDFRLLKNKVLNAQVGLEYDTRDYPLNPRQGVYYLGSYSAGLKRNQGPSYLMEEDSLRRSENLQSLQMQLKFYYNLWSNQVLALHLQGRQVKGSRLQLTDYFWFGGSQSLRGYRENQFRGNVVAWSNLEYRFLMGRNARLFLFSDWGYYQYSADERKVSEWLTGYGMGLRFQTPAGILGVDFGLGKGDAFREAKIHFGLINQF